MAMPKKRMTSARSGNRRSHLALKNISLTRCTNCHVVIVPHRVCYNCGYYKGEKILKFKEKK